VVIRSAVWLEPANVVTQVQGDVAPALNEDCQGVYNSRPCGFPLAGIQTPTSRKMLPVARPEATRRHKHFRGARYSASRNLILQNNLSLRFFV
jgi:hypothetical protein